jgi:hypothetical protein
VRLEWNEGFNMMIMAFSSDWDLGRDTGKGNRGDWLGLGCHLVIEC